LTGSDLFEGDSIEELFYNNKNMICKKATFELENVSVEAKTLLSKLIQLNPVK